MVSVASALQADGFLCPSWFVPSVSWLATVDRLANVPPIIVYAKVLFVVTALKVGLRNNKCKYVAKPFAVIPFLNSRNYK